jgi:hypothetical protein
MVGKDSLRESFMRLPFFCVDYAFRYASQADNQNSIASPSVVAINPPQNARGVFSDFKFKGFPLSISKPLANLKSVGVGFKVPITASFPEYDRRYYLPRVVGFLGVNYPYHWKLAFTITVPIQVFLILALYTIRVRKNLEFAQLNPNHAVKRVGVNISYKYTKKNGVEPSYGAIFNYVANPFLTQTLLPLMLIAPVLALSAVETFGGAIYAVLFVLYYILDHTLFAAARLFAPNATSAVTATAVKSIEDRLSNLLYVKSSWKKVSSWMAKKAQVFGYTMGYLSTPQKTFKVGHSVNFDIQAFNPFNLFASNVPAPSPVPVTQTPAPAAIPAVNKPKTK